MSERTFYHLPVLEQEVLELLVVNKDGRYLDGTLGGGGHFGSIAGRLSEQAVLIGIDRDPEAIAWNREHLGGFLPRIIIEQSPFSLFDEIIRKHDIDNLDGLLLDLGVSSRQIDIAERGFTYMKEARLDMRMNPQSGEPGAQEIIDSSDEGQLAAILGDYGEVQNPARMASAIKRWSSNNPMATSADLRACLAREYGPNFQVKVVAKVFQALRIAVNDELGELRRFLDKVIDMMAPGGRLAIIAYHSLEDRMVKEFMNQSELSCICPPRSPVCTCAKVVLLKRITKKAVQAGSDEVLRNPRARSARLRVAQRVVGKS